MIISGRKLGVLLITFGLLALNAFHIHATMLGVLLIGLLLLFVGSWYGDLLFKHHISWSWRWIWGSGAYSAVFIIVSSAIYMVSDASAGKLFLALAIASLPGLLERTITNQEKHILHELQHAHAVLFTEIKTTFTQRPKSCLATLLVPVPIVIDLYLLQMLTNASTIESILSPWQMISTHFFAWFALSTFLLWRYTSKVFSAFRLGAILLHLFVFFSVAVIVYQIGFGFDGFIHHAAQQTIIDHGVIEPKTPYYIGQYMLTGLLAHAGELSVSLINRWLVPLMASTIIPLSLLWFYRRRKITNSIQPLLLLLLIPLPLLISTTPFALALIFLIATVCISRAPGRAGVGARRVAGLLALASAAIHPLVGIPAIIYMVFVYTETLPRVPKISYLLYTIIGVLLLPLATFFQTGQLPQLDTLHTIAQNVWVFFTQIPAQDATMVMQFVYGYKHILLPIIFVFVVALDVLYFKRVFKKQQSWPLLLTGLIVLINSALLSAVEFPLVIQYEQTDFGTRLLFIAGIFFAPFFFAGLVHILRSQRWDRWFSLLGILLLLGATTSALYLSYPRADRIDRSKQINTTIHDLQTVSTITEHAKDTSYVVLANQSVSAAAIARLGFSPSVTMNETEQFIYPVPTGGPLYPHYLAMVNDRQFIKTVKTVKTATGVERVYFALNHYWAGAKDIGAIAGSAAQEILTINDKVWVFVF